MIFLKLTHTVGTEIYINPNLLRTVQPQGNKGVRMVFDPNHEVFVKEEIERVLNLLDRLA